MAWQTYTTELKLLSQNLCRYAPMMNPNKNMMFPVDGVHVGDDYMCSDKLCLVHLDNLSSESSGSYRCEVSWDLSTFYMETLNLITCLYKFSWRSPVMRLILVSCTRQQTWRLSVSCFFYCIFSFFYFHPHTAAMNSNMHFRHVNQHIFVAFFYQHSLHEHSTSK